MTSAMNSPSTPQGSSKISQRSDRTEVTVVEPRKFGIFQGRLCETWGKCRVPFLAHVPVSPYWFICIKFSVLSVCFVCLPVYRSICFSCQILIQYFSMPYFVKAFYLSSSNLIENHWKLKPAQPAHIKAPSDDGDDWMNGMLQICLQYASKMEVGEVSCVAWYYIHIEHYVQNVNI